VTQHPAGGTHQLSASATAPRPQLSPAVIAVIVLTFVLGLPVDQYGGLPGQLVVSAWTWALFLYLLGRVDQRLRLPLMLCLVISTIGEISLSLGWGLYVYRLENVPLFVPTGHVLLFVLGLSAAPRVPARLVAAVAAAVAIYAVVSLMMAVDTFSVVLAVIFLVCTAFGSAKKLYAAMFLLSLAMELYGTWLGNWAWLAEVPWLPLTSANPPLCVGAFYCVLDLLVMRANHRLEKSRRWSRAAVGAESAA
jgi:hypothetical protein